MLKSIKNLVSSTLSYTFFSILNALGPFLLIPFMTSHLKTKEYGEIAMFTIVISFISPLIGMSINSAITRFYFSLNTIDFGKLISGSIVMLIITIFPLMGIAYIFSNQLYLFTSLNTNVIWLAILVSAFQFIHLIALYIWQVQKKSTIYGLFQVFYTLTNLGLSIILITSFNLNWWGRVFAWLISSIIFSFVAVYFIVKEKLFSFTIDFKIIKNALEFSVPIIPHALGGLMIGLIDRVVVNKNLGLESTGIYSLAFQLSSILNVLFMAFNTAFTPWLFGILNVTQNSNNNKRKIVGIIYLLFFLMSVFSILLYFGINFFFPLFINPKFTKTLQIIPFLLIGFTFSGMYMLISNFIFYSKKTSILAVNTFVFGLFNIPICIYLTKKYGLEGASIATSVSYLLMFLSSWFFSNKAFKMPWLHPSFTLKNLNNG